MFFQTGKSSEIKYKKYVEKVCGTGQNQKYRRILVLLNGVAM